MRRNWITGAILAIACCLAVWGAAVASAEGSHPSSGTGATPPAEAEASHPSSGAGVIPLAEEGCTSGHVCVWPKENYQGTRGESLCTGGPHPLAGIKESAKNRCLNKASWLRLDGFALECMNAGDSFPGTLEFNELWIGAEGSHCN